MDAYVYNHKMLINADCMQYVCKQLDLSIYYALQLTPLWGPKQSL